MSERQEAIAAELSKIAKANGGVLNPADVVEFAKNPKTELHSHFDWSDTEAAEKWRLHQARNIIRVVVTVPESTNTPTRAWVSLAEDRKPDAGYRTIVDVMSDAERRASLLRQAFRDLDILRQKYGVLKELAGVFVAVRRARDVALSGKSPASRRPGSAGKSLAACQKSDSGVTMR